MICINCGLENPDGAKFCQHCGAPQPAVPALTLEPTPEPDFAPMPELSVEPSPAPELESAPVFAPAPEAPLPPVFEVEQPVAPAYAPVPAEVPYDYAQPMYEPEPDVPTDSNVLTWGILALAFGSFGFLVNFLGIIFGIIARKKSNAYINYYGTRTAKERVGRILGTIGIPVGIAMTVFWILYIVCFVVFFAVIGASI